jgi:hypothetical protein
LRCGVDVIGFWDLTIGEIKLITENYRQEEENKAKERVASNYNLAMMVSTFVNNGLNGKPIPSIEELYPKLFVDNTAQQEEEQKRRDELALALYKEQMLDFAAAHNKKRHAKEGEGES